MTNKRTDLLIKRRIVREYYEQWIIRDYCRYKAATLFSKGVNYLERLSLF